MNAWSNIEISPDDPEIIAIDKFEKRLKTIPSNVRQIRNLISGFEVCHFKYQQHIRNIKESILSLKTNIDPNKIGENHIKNGENAWRKDKTGRSGMGQRYVWALKIWIGDNPAKKELNKNEKLYKHISKWLGEKEPEKQRLVRLLIARLMWDWKSYEELLTGKENKELEFQACRMDICHYYFPENLDLLLKGIGELKPTKTFEGCGSYNLDIKQYVEREFSVLNDLVKSISSATQPGKPAFLKAWLYACFAKTLKEQIGVTQAVNV